MALQSFISGPYTSTYSVSSVATAIGATEGGFTITQSSKAQEINKSDTWGDSLLDYVWRGGDVGCNFTVLQATAAAAAAIAWPWSSNRWALRAHATLNPIGRLASDVAVGFVLTSTANTPAAAAPASLTAAKAIIPPSYNFDNLLDSRLRTVLIRLVFLPYDSAGLTLWAVAT